MKSMKRVVVTGMGAITPIRKQRGRILEWNQRAEDRICTDYIF